MSLVIINQSDLEDFGSTGIHLNSSMPQGVRGSIADILNRAHFRPIMKGGQVTVRYQKGIPLIVRLGGKDQSNNSMTELVLISSADYKQMYGKELVTPYFLIHTPSLPLNMQLQGYKGVRVNEVIRLGLDVDQEVASRLCLDKNPYISRYHMELKLLENGEFEVRDLGSTNGTFLSYCSALVPSKDFASKQNIIQRNMTEIAKNPFLSRLWPNLNQGMKQGPVGNCYFVAAINTIKEHPKCVSILSQIVQADPQGYRVQFLGINKFTIISDGDIADMGNKKLHGSLGDHILERAYWRLRHDRYDPSLRGGFRGQIHRTRGTLLASDHRGNKVHEGGWMKEVLSDFLGALLAEVRSIDNIYLTSNSRVLSELNPDNLVTASTPSVECINNETYYKRELFSRFFPSKSLIYQETKESLSSNSSLPITQDMIYANIAQRIALGYITGDRHSFSIVDINNVPQKFYFNHAYSIGHIDHVAGYVELINPHDTQNERFYISIDSFYIYFNNLTIAKLMK